METCNKAQVTREISVLEEFIFAHRAKVPPTMPFFDMKFYSQQQATRMGHYCFERRGQCVAPTRYQAGPKWADSR